MHSGERERGAVEPELLRWVAQRRARSLRDDRRADPESQALTGDDVEAIVHAAEHPRVRRLVRLRAIALRGVRE
jgi:hypothetical protein